MFMDNLTAKLYQSPKTVLTIKDLALIWRENNSDNLKAKVSYYVKQGVLIRLTRGVFVKDREYNPKELATSLYTPSYISFETALRQAGMIFQYYETIFVASKWPKNLEIDGHKITFRKLKDEVLFNPSGVISKDNYNLATPERAFLDMIYIAPNYYFDNLGPLDWEKCARLVKIYNNKQLIKRVDEYHKIYAQS
jgi:predicted transcriptional regulator of viral defense system